MIELKLLVHADLPIYLHQQLRGSNTQPPIDREAGIGT